jgi:hypothetical protein
MKSSTIGGEHLFGIIRVKWCGVLFPSAAHMRRSHASAIAADQHADNFGCGEAAPSRSKGS